MNGTFLLARRHLWHHRWRSIVLIGCLTLTSLLPIGLRIFTSDIENRLTARAKATPLVIGAAGSEFDLALHALYFHGQPARETTISESTRISDSGLAKPIPMLIRNKAEEAPVMGTTTDYLNYRELTVAEGQSWKRLGDCLVGASVARRLSVQPGDSLMTEPENVFDLDSPLPLKMTVSGVLAETNSPDDNAVFVDMKTAWIIAGLGHGHAPSKKEQAPGESSGDQRSSGMPEGAHDASLIEYTEITDENAGSFHFHGDRNSFPVTAILAIPHDEKSETLLMGRYLADDDPAQLIRPVEVIGEILEIVIRIRHFFDLAFASMATVTIALLGLFVVLTVQLRQREFATMYRIGCGRFVILRLVGADLAILFLISGMLTGITLAILVVSRMHFVKIL